MSKRGRCRFQYKGVTCMLHYDKFGSLCKCIDKLGCLEYEEGGFVTLKDLIERGIIRVTFHKIK